MNDTRIIITFNDGTKETIDCSEHIVKDGYLYISIRHQKTMVFPLNNIKLFVIC